MLRLVGDYKEPQKKRSHQIQLYCPFGKLKLRSDHQKWRFDEKCRLVKYLPFNDSDKDSKLTKRDELKGGAFANVNPSIAEKNSNLLQG